MSRGSNLQITNGWEKLNLRPNMQKLCETTEIVMANTGLSIHDFNEWTGRKDSKPSSVLDFEIPQLTRLAHRLNINLDMLMSGEFCTKTASEYLLGNPYAIPEKHIGCSNSKMFTFRHLYELSFFYNAQERFLRTFQLTEESVNSNIDISIELASTASLVFRHSPAELMASGEKNPEHLRTSDFGIELSRSKDWKELMTQWISSEKYIEKNWDYELQDLTENGVKINSFPTEEMMEFHKAKDYGGITIDYFRCGTPAQLPTFIGMNKGTVSLTKSIHTGDAYTQFSVELNG